MHTCVKSKLGQNRDLWIDAGVRIFYIANRELQVVLFFPVYDFQTCLRFPKNSIALTPVNCRVGFCSNNHLRPL